jgi:glutathione S-transferase
MKLYGHPWSLSTRKILMTLAEKGHRAELIVVMIPKGEQRAPEHVARHPFAKVPVIDDDGFVLYEARAITWYLDHKLSGPKLIPQDLRAGARLEQWINVADSYFIPHARPFILETMFRRYLGGEQDLQLIAASRAAMQLALDQADAWLTTNAYFAGTTFSLADIHWMPFVEYLVQGGYAALIDERPQLRAWWDRVSSRPTWQRIARSGPQPFHAGMSVAVLEDHLRAAS